MARKGGKGYWVDGRFVPFGQGGKDGEEPGAPSRTEEKAASHELQALGERLATLPDERLDALPVPERLLEAVRELRRITSPGALRRQKQYIGRLMHGLDDAERAAVAAAVAAAPGRRAR